MGVQSPELETSASNHTRSMIYWRVAAACLLLARPSSCFALEAPSSSTTLLLKRAQTFVDARDAESAFATLAEAYSIDPNARGLPRLFEACLRLRIEEGNDNDSHAAIQDRFGLASLLLDQERYEEASVPLREIIKTDPLNEKASSMLFRTNAACCQWDTYWQDSKHLVDSLRLESRFSQSNVNDVPAVHPFESLKWPSVSLLQATQIASLYARRAASSIAPIQQNDAFFNQIQNLPKQNQLHVPSVTTVSKETNSNLPSTKIRVGYLSPDFTSKHPLAFLIQDVFCRHNRQEVSVHLYSLAPLDGDDTDEVRRIQNGSDSFTVLPASASSAQDIADRIRKDELDILVDLCGYAGTMLVAQIMSQRPAPIQISYMGFPGSAGAPYLDYMVCDPVVVPRPLRPYYTERMIWMPHCYFVNSHATCASEYLLTGGNEERRELRRTYGLPVDGFVYCCHSRPDKIDPSTFSSWLAALTRARQHDANCVLWLLRSGVEMENNLRRIAKTEFQLDDKALVFADIAPRKQHLQRLGVADLFMDTPAYNAHTLGCDTLFVGVPMITLLRPPTMEGEEDENSTASPVEGNFIVYTDKLASRVGASLLLAVGLDELICASIQDYEDLMVKCAIDMEWYTQLRSRLVRNRYTYPLFDTQRWVTNWELALRHIALSSDNQATDIHIHDSRTLQDEDIIH